MRFPYTPITVAGRQRVLDVPALLDYNDFLFRKSQSHSNFLLHGTLR